MSNLDGRTLIYLAVNGVTNDVPQQLEQAGWNVTVTDNIEAARQSINENKIYVGLVELSCEHSEACLYKLEELLRQFVQVEWIALVHAQTISDPRLKQFIADSFFDFHTLPVESHLLLSNVGHAHGMARMKWDDVYHTDDSDFSDEEMVGSSPQIHTLFSAIRKVAGVSAPVLITGESGTGKELTAHAVHERSKYAEGPFVTVNCGAIPQSLIQSELFGYEKGAFTGANVQKIGHIEAANGGTIFLDEIGDIPLEQQINLLRFLQERTIQRVGGSEQIPVDARVIAATHIDLEQAVREGRLREDLYYRLNVLQVRTPPLRERSGDIELLAKYFFKKFIHEKSKNVKGFSQTCLDVMRDYRWEGNVRELINRIRRAMVMCDNRLISAADMGISQSAGQYHFLTLKEAKDRAEKEAISNALARADNNLTLAAKNLAVSRVTLYRLLEKHAITIDD